MFRVEEITGGGFTLILTKKSKRLAVEVIDRYYWTGTCNGMSMLAINRDGVKAMMKTTVTTKSIMAVLMFAYKFRSRMVLERFLGIRQTVAPATRYSDNMHIFKTKSLKCSRVHLLTTGYRSQQNAFEYFTKSGWATQLYRSRDTRPYVIMLIIYFPTNVTRSTFFLIMVIFVRIYMEIGSGFLSIFWKNSILCLAYPMR